jgi:hypothetical protein
MKPTPCDYCGATYHQPYEDGLVECRETLRMMLVEACDEREVLRKMALDYADEIEVMREALEQIARYPTLAAGWQSIAKAALVSTSATTMKGEDQ